MIKQISLILTVIVFSSIVVLAQTTPNIELVNPGTTPDSALYFLDLAIENLGLALTFNDNIKIEKEFDIAEERLSEARKMALENKLDAMAKAEEKHNEILTRIKERLKNKDTKDSKGELKKELQIEQKINAHEIKVKNVKNELKLEIKIKGELTSEQQQLLDSLIASFENQAEEVGIEINNEKKETKIKIKEQTGENGEDVEDELQKELEIEDDDKIEIDVENGVAKVKVEINDIKERFELKVNITQSEKQIKEQVMNEISKRYLISIEEVKKITEEFEIEDEKPEEKEAPEKKELDNEDSNKNHQTEINKESEEEDKKDDNKSEESDEE